MVEVEWATWRLIDLLGLIMDKSMRLIKLSTSSQNRALHDQPAFMRDSLGLDILLKCALRTIEPKPIHTQEVDAQEVDAQSKLTDYVVVEPITENHSKLKKVLRPVARLVFRLLKPLLRPLAARWRTYMSHQILSVLGSELQRHASGQAQHLQGLHADMRTGLAEQAQYLQGLHADMRTGLAEQAQYLQALHAHVRTEQAEQAQHLQALHADMRTGQQNTEPALTRILELSTVIATRVAIPLGNNELLIRAQVGYVLCTANDDALVTCLVDTGELERGTRLIIQKILRFDDSYVDVGANIGLHVLAAGHIIREEGSIIAIEPFPKTKALLERTIWLNGLFNMTTIHEVAVSNFSGKTKLFIGKTSGHHSLYPLDYNKGHAEHDYIDVDTVTLDEIVKPYPGFTLIKIDVEGEEVNVLQGMKRLLSTDNDVALIVEFGPSHLNRTGTEVTYWFAQFECFGFEHFAIDELTGEISKNTIEDLCQKESVNLLFVRQKSQIWDRL
jgi:FkbM family methyltransferase